MIIPFGILAVTAALLTIIFLPETMGKHLPDTIEEVIKIIGAFEKNEHNLGRKSGSENSNFEG